MVCYHYTVREQPLEAEITDSTCCLFWHVTLRAAQRGNFRRAFKYSRQKILPRNRAPFNIVFLLNYIMYINNDLGQI